GGLGGRFPGGFGRRAKGPPTYPSSNMDTPECVAAGAYRNIAIRTLEHRTTTPCGFPLPRRVVLGGRWPFGGIRAEFSRGDSSSRAHRGLPHRLCESVPGSWPF